MLPEQGTTTNCLFASQQGYFPLVIDRPGLAVFLTALGVNPSRVEQIVDGDFFESDEDDSLKLPHSSYPCLLEVSDVTDVDSEAQFLSILIYVQINSLKDALNLDSASLVAPVVDSALLEQCQQNLALTLSDLLAYMSYLEREDLAENDAEPMCLPLYFLTTQIGEKGWTKVFQLHCHLLLASQLNYFPSIDLESDYPLASAQLTQAEMIKMLAHLGLFPHLFKLSPYAKLEL